MGEGAYFLGFGQDMVIILNATMLDQGQDFPLSFCLK